jgi:hypothetical protein
METAYKRNINKTDFSQNRYENIESIHKHPYDPQLLEEVRNDLLKPRTCKELMEWVDTHPHYDVIAEASSQYLRGTHKDDCFWQVAQIEADWIHINERITDYAKAKNLDTNFKTDYTDEWRISKLEKEQDNYSPFRHNSELDNQHKHGFIKHYQLIEVTLTDLFPEIKAIEEAFNFQLAKSDINYQPTSGAFPRHVDFLSTMLKRAIEHDSNIANARYNPITKSPEGWQLKRIIMPAESWYPGQMFSFEEHIWSNWEPGMAMDFSWQHCRHATANSGYNARPLIKIQGLIRDDHWLARGEFKRIVI